MVGYAETCGRNDFSPKFVLSYPLQKRLIFKKRRIWGVNLRQRGPKHFLAKKQAKAAA
jgi:hypothetical protein